MTKKKQNTQDGFEQIEGALTKTEQYIEENQKSLTVIILAIFVLFGGYYGYKKFILQPKEKQAQAEMFWAERNFAQDSFNLAIAGDVSYAGFEDIVDEYAMTKSANLANYYTGISFLRTGQFEEAIDALKDFDGSDKIVASISLGAIGDAYLQMEDVEKAMDFYDKAASYDDNRFTAPIYLMKLGQIQENEEMYDKALKSYTQIQENYPESTESRGIQKYITQVKVKMEE